MKNDMHNSFASSAEMLTAALDPEPRCPRMRLVEDPGGVVAQYHALRFQMLTLLASGLLTMMANGLTLKNRDS